MNGKDTWLKLHTSILLSARFLSLPTNDDRWAYICLLILAKKRLESVQQRQLLGHLNLSKRRWRQVRKNLEEAGLVDQDGQVIGFEDSQLSPEAIRKRRQRERDMSRDKSRDSHKDSRKQIVESRKQSKKEEEEPPVVPHGGPPFAAIVSDLNEQLNKTYKTGPVSKKIKGLIRARWAEGFREEHFAQVVKIKKDQWETDDRMVHYLRPETLWTTRMESYLQEGTTTTEWDKIRKELEDELGRSG